MVEPIVYRWDVYFGKPFKVGKARAAEMIENGELKFRADGRLDRRYRSSRFVLRHFPDLLIVRTGSEPEA